MITGNWSMLPSSCCCRDKWNVAGRVSKGNGHALTMEREGNYFLFSGAASNCRLFLQWCSAKRKTSIPSWLHISSENWCWIIFKIWGTWRPCDSVFRIVLIHFNYHHVSRNYQFHTAIPLQLNLFVVASFLWDLLLEFPTSECKPMLPRLTSYADTVVFCKMCWKLRRYTLTIMPIDFHQLYNIRAISVYRYEK